MKARLVTFHRQTEPLIDLYRQAGLLHEIDGEGDVTEIFERSLAVVRNLGSMELPAATAAVAS